MIRTQIQLREDQSKRLQQLAAELGCSVAELIRQSVDRLLDSQAVPAQQASRLSALKVIGWGASGLKDVSARHDEYLAASYLDSVGDSDSHVDSAAARSSGPVEGEAQQH